MCRIAGIASHDRGDLDRSALAAMSAALAHRGADDAGEARLDGCMLAARRLSIIDVQGGHQPLSGCGERVTVVQNGEIYNHAELRARLAADGHSFRTRCDTEVHAHAYEEWGDAFVERLRGMFAIALWDAEQRRLLLARDRFGIKPLFYAAHGGRLAFASELTALTHAPAAYDEPSGDSSALPTYVVCGLAAQHVKVVLAGEGGDELFGGYETYVADRLAPVAGPLARIARPVVERLPSRAGRVPLDYKLKRFVRATHLPALERHLGFKEIFAPELRRELRRDGPASDPLDLYRARYAETAGAAPLARLQDADLGLYLVDDLLVKTDRLSMAHSLEARVPFLDPAVAELALALPTRHKVLGASTKRLLRRAVAPLVPREITSGRKRGFSIPAAAWLRGPLLPFARELLSAESLRAQGVFDPAAAGRVLERHASGAEDLSRQLWGLIGVHALAAARRSLTSSSARTPTGSTPRSTAR